ncbi:MAG TPA: hypothetical protein VMZ32_01135 [Gammaproteobacteria bacterium]|nr:hypothetical protein [Gammaproteobacteria bacterium]
MISLFGKLPPENAKHRLANRGNKPKMPTQAIPFFIMTLLVRFKVNWRGLATRQAKFNRSVASGKARPTQNLVG